eukprot:6210077-Pleurochrysis_carterae.AAC.2
MAETAPSNTSSDVFRSVEFAPRLTRPRVSAFLHRVFDVIVPFKVGGVLPSRCCLGGSKSTTLVYVSSLPVALAVYLDRLGKDGIAMGFFSFKLCLVAAFYVVFFTHVGHAMA